MKTRKEYIDYVFDALIKEHSLGKVIATLVNVTDISEQELNVLLTKYYKKPT